MKYALKSLNYSSNQASASVVDGKLILSFPHAITPVVWQMDLSQAKASALEVHENKDTGVATLVLKTPGGSNTDIAPFEKKSQAVDGLMAASRALESAHGQIRGVASDNIAMTRPREAASTGKWIAAILALVMLFVLVNIWGSNLPQGPASVSNATSSLSPPPMAEQNGVPLSAEDLLSNPVSQEP